MGARMGLRVDRKAIRNPSAAPTLGEPVTARVTREKEEGDGRAGGQLKATWACGEETLA